MVTDRLILSGGTEGGTEMDVYIPGLPCWVTRIVSD